MRGYIYRSSELYEIFQPQCCTANALYRKFETNIPRIETARPVAVSDSNIPNIGPQTQYSKMGVPIVGINKSLTDT